MDSIENATVTLTPLPYTDNISICYFSSQPKSVILRTYAYYINGPFLLIVALTGFVGNILCLLAFGRSRRPRQINYYLIALSSWDLCLVTGSFFLYNLPYLLYGRVITQGAYVLAYPFVYTLACASHTGSIWAVLASAVDRYFALCHPLSHKIYSCARRTAVILGVVAGFVLLYNLPRYYELEMSSCFDSKNGARVPVVRGSRLRADPRYWLWYKVVGGLLFFSLGPLLALTCLSVKVWSAVRQLTRDLPVENTAMLCSQNKNMGVKRRLPLKKTSSVGSMSAVKLITAPKTRRVLRRHSTLGTVVQESQYTLNSMLLTVIVKFVVCHSLPTALDVCEAVMPAEKFNSVFVSNIVATSNFLVVCNSSINFFIYCICSRRFRHDLCTFIKYISGSSIVYRNGVAARPFDSQHCATSLIRIPTTVDSYNCRRATIAML